MMVQVVPEVFLHLFALRCCFFSYLDIVEQTHLIVIWLQPDRVLHVRPHIHRSLIPTQLVPVVRVLNVLIVVIFLIIIVGVFQVGISGQIVHVMVLRVFA